MLNKREVSNKKETIQTSRFDFTFFDFYCEVVVDVDDEADACVDGEEDA